MTQPDTIVPDPYNSQDWDRYAYARNNPIRYNDPSGHFTCSSDKNSDDYCPGKPSGSITSPYKPQKPKPMETSEQGEDLIKYYEGHNAGNESYPDLYPYEDEGGTCTIGWGHVLQRGGCNGWPRKTYGNGITTSLAQEIFDNDIDKFEGLINNTITVDLTQAQFDALVSYTFNTGDQTNNPYFVKGIPDLINNGNFEAAAEAIRSGPNTTGDPPVFIDKLVERRNVEANLFLFGIYFP